MNKILWFPLTILLGTTLCCGQALPDRLASDDVDRKNRDPYVDVTRYGVRALVPTAIPVTSGITATIRAGGNTATISTVSCPSQTGSVCFRNGDGVVIYGAGPTCSLSTPVAPTVTPSVDGGNTGSGFVYTGPSGGLTYQYQVVAVDQHGCYTSASAVKSITNGQPLGLQSVAVISCSRDGNIVTCTTSAPHTLAAGAVVSIYQTSDDINFGTWEKVDTVPDSRHFTYTSGIDLSNGNNILTNLSRQEASPGNGTFATGGTVTWFNLNRITVKPVAGAWEYCVYGRTPGNMNWIGCGKPQGTGLSTISDLTFDDYGPTMMANFVQPGWLPATPPSSGQADWFSTTIVSDRIRTAAPLRSLVLQR